MPEQNFWQRMWPLFMSDPPTFLTLMAAAVVPVAGAAWWLKGTVADRKEAGLNAQIDNLKSQMAVLNERLALAADQNKYATAQLEAGQKEIAELREQIKNRAQESQISETADKAARRLVDAFQANSIVTNTLRSGDGFDVPAAPSGRPPSPQEKRKIDRRGVGMGPPP
jgi:hypothetical protein